MNLNYDVCLNSESVEMSYIVTCLLKAGMVEQDDAAIARQQHGKHIFAAMNHHAAVEELLEAVELDLDSVWYRIFLSVTISQFLTFS
jgi:hypothetical protein